MFRHARVLRILRGRSWNGWNHWIYWGWNALKIDQTSKFITLDWDNINLHQAISQYNAILESPNVKRATLSRSARKGFHCRVWFLFPVLVARCRFGLGDDPRRLLHDLFNRPAHIHDILWTRKTIGGITHKAQTVVEWSKPDLWQ